MVAADVTKFDMIKTARPGATFLLNTPWKGAELDALLPTKMKQTIAERNLDFYTIDATRVAKDAGLGQRINTVMQSAFYHLSGVRSSPVCRDRPWRAACGERTCCRRGVGVLLSPAPGHAFAVAL